MNTLSVSLQVPATEMAQEEITKQVAFLASGISNVRFSADGASILFDNAAALPESQIEDLVKRAAELGNRMNRALRNLERKLVFQSSAAKAPSFDRSPFLSGEPVPGIHFLGTGQVALFGLPLKVFRYFDRIFTEFGAHWKAEAFHTPTLIPSTTLSRCDYFRSFPQNVTFASHLREDAQLIESFRARHQDLDCVDHLALGDMATPEACLSPAVCYHCYGFHANQTLPDSGTVYTICGKCFRYESSNITDLRRLWDFTMREVVFVGGRDYVLAEREKSIELMQVILEDLQLAGEIRTASDPFFIAPDAVSKTYFQLRSDSKFEMSLMLPNNERVAVGSHNYHSDFFGKAFNTGIVDAGPMHSVCVAWGLERWTYAFLVQHGLDPARWPDAIRKAPEFA